MAGSETGSRKAVLLNNGGWVCFETNLKVLHLFVDSQNKLSVTGES